MTVLNPAAADIWDALVETRNVGSVRSRYARLWPDRTNQARSDVDACLQAWESQGLFAPPELSWEQRQIHQSRGISALADTQISYRRNLQIAGVSVALEIEDERLGQVMSDLLVDFPDSKPGCARTLRVTGPEDGWRLFLDGVLLRIASGLAQARGQIVRELIRITEPDAGWLATAHGAVLSKSSAAVFLSGPSGAGKSTLSAALVANGWKLLAEDCAAFDDRMHAVPMPFPLSVKEGSLEVLRDAYPQLSSARVHQLANRRVRYQGVPAHRRAPLPERPRLLIDVRYAPELNARTATTRRLSPVEALGLFLNDESFVAFENRHVGAFLDFVETTPALEIHYGSTAAAEQVICEWLNPSDNGGPCGEAG